MATTDAPMPLLPPGGLFEIVFSFDTTGSMSRAIEEVKGRLQDMIQRLQADIPGIRLGVIAHGDYCDKDVFYLEKHVDLTTNVAELCQFVHDVEGTGGGDPEECYEYILNMTSGFDWTPGSQRALVLIADSIPHGPDYDLNVGKLDWRNEATLLANKGIKIYGVQAFDEADSTAFFEELVGLTSGQHLKLAEFSNLCDFIMAICYRERGEEFLEGYEAEVRARERRMNKDLEGLFGVLRRGDSSTSQVTNIPTTSNAKDPSGPAVLSRHSSSFSDITPMDSGSDSDMPMDTTDSHVAIVKPMVVPSPCISKSPRVVKTKRVHVSKKKVSVKQIKSKVTDTGATRKELRHKVRDTNFILMQGNLKQRWSKWKLAISNTEPKSTRNWLKRSEQNDDLGWKRKKLFPCESSHARVLYEIAIQKRKGGKMTVVLSKWSTLNADPLKWEKRLFGKNVLAINSAIEEGSKVFIRRFMTKQMGKNQKQTVRDYKHAYHYEMDGLMKIITINNKRHCWYI